MHLSEENRCRRCPKKCRHIPCSLVSLLQSVLMVKSKFPSPSTCLPLSQIRFGKMRNCNCGAKINRTHLHSVFATYTSMYCGLAFPDATDDAYYLSCASKRASSTRTLRCSLELLWPHRDWASSCHHWALVQIDFCEAPSINVISSN